METKDDNLISLAGEIAKGSHLLIDQEMAILRAELLEEWKASKKAVPFLLVSSVAAITVSLLASLAVAHWLVVRMVLPLWQAYGVVAFIGLAVGLTFYGVGRRRLQAISLMPRETLKSFKENLKCLTN